MDVSPALWDLTVEWRDWASQPVQPFEDREIALHIFLDCIAEKKHFFSYPI